MEASQISDESFPVNLRAQLARITQNFVEDEEDEGPQVTPAQQAVGFTATSLTLHNNATSVSIHEDRGHRLHYGATIWRVCKRLCNYFDQQDIGTYKGKRALELGSGTGLAGLALASLGATVIATDTKMALPLIRHNLELNSNLVNNVNIKELEWFEAPDYISDFSPPFDYLIASDVVSFIYNSTAHRALANVVSLLSSPTTIVYVAYQERGIRGSQETFFKIMKEKGFNKIEEVIKEEDSGDKEDGILVHHIVVLSKSDPTKVS